MSRAIVLIILYSQLSLSSILMPVYCSDNNFRPIPLTIRLRGKRNLTMIFCVHRNTTVFIVRSGLGNPKKGDMREREV